MSLLNRIFKSKVQDTSEKQRLVVALNERPLREHFMSPEALAIVKQQREYWEQFHENGLGKQLTNPKKKV